METWRWSWLSDLDVVGSYRTYEEWKPSFLMASSFLLYSSYRTYEEWKQGNGISESEAGSSSYRTYEEWKLACVCRFLISCS